MIISKLEYQKKDPNRVSVFIDDEYAFGCDIKYVLEHSLNRGREIEETEISQIVRKDFENTLYRRAINYLSRGLKTTYQMRTYLLKILQKAENRSYEDLNKEDLDNLINLVLKRLTEDGLIDDREFVIQYASSLSHKKVSKAYLLGKLSQKGIDRKFAETVLEDISEEFIDEEEAISDLLMKKYGKSTLTSKDQKEIRYLLGKGFEWDNISKFVER